MKTLKEKIKTRELLTPDEAAKWLGYNKYHLLRLCRERKLEFIRRGRKIFFTEQALQSFFKVVFARTKTK